VSTEHGIVSGRCIREIAASEHSKKMILNLVGVPWNPKLGMTAEEATGIPALPPIEVEVLSSSSSSRPGSESPSDDDVEVAEHPAYTPKARGDRTPSEEPPPPVMAEVVDADERSPSSGTPQDMRSARATAGDETQQMSIATPPSSPRRRELQHEGGAASSTAPAPKWRKVGEGRYDSSPPASPDRRPRPDEDDGEVAASVKRTKHDEVDLSCFTREEYLITGLSFDLAIDEVAVQNLDDTEWLWEEPDLKYDAPITADDCNKHGKQSLIT
jgi:hypothetical protein